MDTIEFHFETQGPSHTVYDFCQMNHRCTKSTSLLRSVRESARNQNVTGVGKGVCLSQDLHICFLVHRASISQSPATEPKGLPTTNSLFFIRFVHEITDSNPEPLANQTTTPLLNLMVDQYDTCTWILLQSFSNARKTADQKTMPVPVARSDARSLGIQTVVGSILGSGNILS